jgi:hypothetical protein
MKNNKKTNDWLKFKKYLHLSPPFEAEDKKWVINYVSNPKKVSAHRFYPFIHYSVKANGFRRIMDTATGLRNRLRSKKQKTREIYYANHLDSCIYSYYGKLINDKLDEIYKGNESLNNSVIAYRRIAVNEHRNKCNIDFANEVFQYIRSSNQLNLTVLCFDIKSFFDTLNHKILKKAWCKLLDEKCLPTDHYQVFKAITDFVYVEIGDLIEEFEELKIKKMSYIKERALESFCKTDIEFRERVKKKGLIKANKIDFKKGTPRIYGIPQGSPISATLSNLYLLDFDRFILEQVENIGGLYKRYSDDILVVCPIEHAEVIKNSVYNYIKEDLKLIIQAEKTQEVVFRRDNVTKPWNYATTENGQPKKTPLSYLGFDFDGGKITVRQKSLALYYRNIKRLIRRKVNYAKSAKKYIEKYPNRKKDDWIYRARIYKTKSHLGAKRKRLNNKVFWGNYISYIKTASKIMNEPALNKQVKNHWRIIERLINKAEILHELPKTPSRRKKKTS